MAKNISTKETNGVKEVMPGSSPAGVPVSNPEVTNK